MARILIETRMLPVEDYVQRYISNELTHFVGRRLDADNQYTVLIEILRSGLLSHDPHDRTVIGNLEIRDDAKLSNNTMYAPQAVCFCDIPFEHLAIHMSKYSQFGISFHKDFIAQSGGSPVFYVARKARVKTARSHPPELIPKWRAAHTTDEVESFLGTQTKDVYFDWIILEYRKLREQSKTIPDIDREMFRFFDFHVFSQMVFFDHQLPDHHSENFYFEREWRIIGNLTFSINDVIRIILPERFSRRLREDCPDYYGQVSFTPGMAI
jgi:hypothetical protein